MSPQRNVKKRTPLKKLQQRVAQMQLKKTMGEFIRAYCHERIKAAYEKCGEPGKEQGKQAILTREDNKIRISIKQREIYNSPSFQKELKNDFNSNLDSDRKILTDFKKNMELFLKPFEKIMEIIAERQKKYLNHFFDTGELNDIYLELLTGKKIAEEINFAESTISRLPHSINLEASVNRTKIKKNVTMKNFVDKGGIKIESGYIGKKAFKARIKEYVKEGLTVNEIMTNLGVDKKHTPLIKKYRKEIIIQTMGTKGEETKIEPKILSQYKSILECDLITNILRKEPGIYPEELEERTIKQYNKIIKCINESSDPKTLKKKLKTETGVDFRDARIKVYNKHIITSKLRKNFLNDKTYSTDKILEPYKEIYKEKLLAEFLNTVLKIFPDFNCNSNFRVYESKIYFCFKPDEEAEACLEKCFIPEEARKLYTDIKNYIEKNMKLSDVEICENLRTQKRIKVATKLIRKFRENIIINSILSLNKDYPERNDPKTEPKTEYLVDKITEKYNFKIKLEFIERLLKKIESIQNSCDQIKTIYRKTSV
jgi:hypothetical protein